MKEHIFIDGNRASNELPLRSLSYGEGVFESFRYKNKLPVLLNEHMSRMQKGASLLKIPLPSKDYVVELIENAVAESGIDDAYVKICLLSRGDSIFYKEPNSSQVLVIIKQYVPINKMLRLKINSFNTISNSPLNAIKSMNYLGNTIARREAQGAGYDEALFLNEREEIVECSSCNLFWYKKGKLYTPSEETGCLPGTTRGLILDCLGDSGIETESGRFKVGDLQKLEFVFVTSSLMGCIPVMAIDNNLFSTDSDLFSTIKNIVVDKLKWA